VGSDDQTTAAFEPTGDQATAAVAEPPLVASGRRLGDRYRLERPLGQGGMAAVWLATDERLGRPVAIKVISEALAHDDGYVERFRREAKVAAGLQHPNLVAVYDFDAGARPYLVMECVSGGDLAARINAGERLDAERLARELLAALRHIHGAGVVHRDIKPQNVLVDDAGRARLTDFGIARPSNATALTRTGQVIGTERYIAPEVMRGAEADERSDLFALGVLLAEVARDGAGAPFWELTDRLRAADPARRPRSAAVALATLERRSALPEPGPATQAYEPLASAGAPPPRRPPATESPLERAFDPEPAASQERSGRWKAITALALAVLAVAVIVGLALSSGDGGGSGGEANSGGGGGKTQKAEANGGDGGGAAGASAPATEQPATEPEPDPAPAGADGVALNDEGFALLGDGRYDEAIPVLERAREALAGSGDTATYNYALFNLASAYLGAGRPDDAIPLLRERLEWDDGQLAEVRAKLDEAYAAAGEAAPSERSGGKPNAGPAPGGGPPPWAGGDD
jgi:tetratricopeptide (TPR) repeat protein